jgi:hypothetical protein
MDHNTQERKQKIKLLQINLQNCRSATSTLSEFYKNNDIDILLIQEPYCINNKIALFPQTTEILQTDIKPKAAIIYTKLSGIKGMILEKFSNELTIWSVLTIDNQDIHLCSAYMPPSTAIEPILDHLNDSIKEIIPKNLLICCDSNAKSNVWYSTTNNIRGDQILEFVLKNDLKILNNSTEPTFFTPHGQSHIDLTLTNISSDIINDWKVHSSVESNSDHCYITFEININHNQNQNRTSSIRPTANDVIVEQTNKKYNINKMDINLFKSEIKSCLTSLNREIEVITNKESLDSFVQDYTQKVIEICDKTIPLKKTYQKTNYWWNEELTKTRKSVNKLRRKFQKCKNPLIRQQKKHIYYCAKINYQKLIKESKIKSWRKFCFESRVWDLPYKICFNKL